MKDEKKKKIIIAPLNWGLGHATRCVPIINALIDNNFEPIIGSDGKALEFLKQEFPDLERLQLPSYHIKYSKNLKLNIVLQFPKIWKAVKKEKEVIRNFIDKNKDVVGIISDNRFGVISKKVPSVYITHQLKVLSGFTTFLTSFVHQNRIKKFDECWIPDLPDSEFSGKLSKANGIINSKFIGVLSRFSKEEFANKIDILVLLSGPESNRTLFEKKLIDEFKNDSRKIVFVLGKVEKEQKKWHTKNITFFNYLLSNELEQKIKLSNLVVCRSGYSSVMDLAILQKKVFFIPTKNQSEQEYLAKHLEQKQLAPFEKEDLFTRQSLKRVENYKGLTSEKNKIDGNLFRLFQSKRKF